MVTLSTYMRIPVPKIVLMTSLTKQLAIQRKTITLDMGLEIQNHLDVFHVAIEQYSHT